MQISLVLFLTLLQKLMLGCIRKKGDNATRTSPSVNLLFPLTCAGNKPRAMTQSKQKF